MLAFSMCLRDPASRWPYIELLYRISGFFGNHGHYIIPLKELRIDGFPRGMTSHWMLLSPISSQVIQTIYFVIVGQWLCSARNQSTVVV